MTVDFEHGDRTWVQELLDTLADTLDACDGAAGILTGQAPRPLCGFPADAVVVSNDNALS